MKLIIDGKKIEAEGKKTISGEWYPYPSFVRSSDFGTLRRMSFVYCRGPRSKRFRSLLQHIY